MTAPRRRRYPATLERAAGRLPPSVRVGLAYAVLRLALFVLVLGVGILAGLRGLLLVVVAFVVSSVLSLPLGRRQREAMASITRDRIAGRRRDG